MLDFHSLTIYSCTVEHIGRDIFLLLMITLNYYNLRGNHITKITGIQDSGIVKEDMYRNKYFTMNRCPLGNYEYMLN